MATAESPLNPESTTFADPARQQVPPKSYAAVVEGELPAYERNGISEATGANGTMSTDGMNGTAPVQKIVDADATIKSEEVVEDRSQSEKVGMSKGHIEVVCAPIISIHFAESDFYRDAMRNRNFVPLPERVES